MIITQTTINLSSQLAPPIIQAVQGDTGRAVCFTLADYTIPDGADATYYIQKPSGEAVYNSATIAGNTITCELTAQSLAELGENNLQVRIIKDEDIVTSFDVILLVRPFRGIDAIESDTEMNIFDKAVAAAKEEFQTEAEEIAAEVIESIPEDYTELTEEVSELNERLDATTTTYNYTIGKNLDSSTGELIDAEGICVSPMIPYTWTGSTAYECGDNTSYVYRIEFYDMQGNHLQGFRNPSTTGNYTYRSINAETQVTGTVGYVRFSFKQGTTGKAYGNESTVYWTATATTVKGVWPSIGNLDNLETTNKDTLVGAINEVNGNIPDISLPITPSDTNFFYTSPNMVDPTTFVANEYVNQVSGEFTSYNGHTRTGYVPVTAGATYCIINPDDYNAGIRYAFYTSGKTYISGAAVNLADIGNLLTAPATAAYIVVSASTIRFPLMIAQSTTKISYAEYGVIHIISDYIVPGDVTNLTVNLPSKLYALVGYELNVYYENLVENWENYNFNASCSKGMDMKRGYRITPEEDDVGSYTLTITVSTKDGKSQKSVSTTLVVTSASAGSGENPSVIVLGDSTTNSGYAVTHFKQNFADDVMDITLYGTRGTSPYLHEGRSGWTFYYYFSTAGSGSVLNPFYNPTSETFDANYYFTNGGVSVPDWIFINLGINDMFSYTSDSAVESWIEFVMGYCNDMIASFQNAAPNAKIGLCLTIPPNHSQDAFGKAYGCDQTRNRYKRNNVMWVSALIEAYDNRTDEGIYLVPIYTNLDTVYNMGMETLPVNARNTGITYESPIANGGVHPVEAGYWQIADVYTAFIKANV